MAGSSKIGSKRCLGSTSLLAKDPGCRAAVLASPAMRMRASSATLRAKTASRLLVAVATLGIIAAALAWPVSVSADSEKLTFSPNHGKPGDTIVSTFTYVPNPGKGCYFSVRLLWYPGNRLYLAGPLVKPAPPSTNCSGSSTWAVTGVSGLDAPGIHKICGTPATGDAPKASPAYGLRELHDRWLRDAQTYAQAHAQTHSEADSQANGGAIVEQRSGKCCPASLAPVLASPSTAPSSGPTEQPSPSQSAPPVAAVIAASLAPSSVANQPATSPSSAGSALPLVIVGGVIAIAVLGVLAFGLRRARAGPGKP